MNNSPVSEIAYRYPQLSLMPKEGLRETDEYKNIALKGIFPENISIDHIHGSEKDSLISYNTPAGNVDVIHLDNREDFIHFIRILAYRGEPRVIPDSIGAVSVLKIMNFRIGEKDSIIITSKGGYSAVNDYRIIQNLFSEIDSDEKWIKASEQIRTYHELAHFVSRRLYPSNKESIRDEVIADATGIIKTFGRYNKELARLFLGVEGSEYRAGGRLEHYVGEDQDIDTVATRALGIVEAVFDFTEGNIVEPFDTLVNLEKLRIGIEE